MADVGALLLRLAGITLSFIVALAAAGFFFTLALSGILDPGSAQSLAEHWFTILPLAVVVTATAGSLALVPFFIIVLVSEYFALRGLVFHLLAGTAIGGLAVWMYNQQAADPTAKAFAVGAAAGTIGGFAYWLLAGRSAGRTFGRIVNGQGSSGS
ncbi:MAG: hypothetical protein R3D65_18430 [Zhengella sp.]|uniref:hypothetical protein n=1 Tax=Zhengella sp. TaxID=2282762 RepID=UPI001D9161FD|nr:hypothetical protein [Notoacmeibacter sp.]MCC0028347.1 hypothetical protein [Brucellaceae bacterium]